ncbi:DNA integration/recombination/invertion protein [Yersinia ruckeri ATCC 29473]|nr:DNA integration/recombination/invertion protein [Yersinia ruckeri ATCC 29473]CEK25742.1 hypothetical protein CSF007_p0310 [Yersinia ruckeri]
MLPDYALMRQNQPGSTRSAIWLNYFLFRGQLFIERLLVR